MSFDLHILTALEDNYIYLFRWGNECAVVDPSEAAPVLEFLQKHQLTLRTILNTHHHYDHVGGNEALKKLTQCKIIGPNDNRIPFLDLRIKEGESITIGPFHFNVIEAPGHTTTHILYHEPERKWLFCGDTLFGCGCGRLFEGSPEQMLCSINKILKLPLETQLYWGHEYTLEDLEFAIFIEPNNQALKEYYNRVKTILDKGGYAVPSTVEIEHRFNPFLRSNDPNFKKALQMSDQTDLQVFTTVRSQRDEF